MNRFARGLWPLTLANIKSYYRDRAALFWTIAFPVLFTPDVPATVGALLDLGEEVGAGGLDIAIRRPTLEDVFLELTGRALRD